MCSITVIKIVDQLSIGFALKEFEEMKLTGEINFDMCINYKNVVNRSQFTKFVLVQRKIMPIVSEYEIFQ